MSVHRRVITCLAGALGASGLILGGVGVPASAGDVNAAGNPSASVEAQDGCVTAAAGTGGADGSVDPQESNDATTLEVSGQGSATVTVCDDDLGGMLPEDPGGSLPDDIGDSVSDELDDVVPGEPGGSLEGEVVGVVEAALDGDLPGGGDGDLPDALDGIVPDDGDGSFPGDPADLPGGVGDLVPDGSGIDPSDLIDRLGQIIPGAGDGNGPGDHDNSGPGGNGGGAPAVNTSTNGSVSVGGVDAERGDPTDAVLGADIGGGAPALVGTSVSPGGTLPRTGGGLGHGVLRLVAVLGLGRALLGLAKRR